MADLRSIVVIPSYNDLAPLREVVEAAASVADVFIVDDGSTDGTAAWLKSSKFPHLSHKKNLGYDSALISGLTWAISNNYELAVTFDADGQHKISDLKLVIETLQSGSRLVVPYRERFARFSEVLYAFFTSSLLGIKDPMTGLKGYDLRLVSVDDINKISGTIGFGLALQMRLSGEVPNQFAYQVLPRRESSPNFGGLVRGNVRIIKGLMKTLQIIFKSKGSSF